MNRFRQCDLCGSSMLRCSPRCYRCARPVVPDVPALIAIAYSVLEPPPHPDDVIAALDELDAADERDEEMRGDLGDRRNWG